MTINAERRRALVVRIQNIQSEIRAACYDALNEGDDERLSILNKLYDATIDAIQELAGKSAHCAEVDCDAWALFSDLFKDRNGFRPRGHWTREEVLNYRDVLADEDLVD